MTQRDPAMNTPKPLLSLDEALARLAAGAAPFAIAETETLSTFDALGRVLAAEVRSLLDVPPADNSSMDGYALRLSDLGGDASVLRPAAKRAKPMAKPSTGPGLTPDCASA